MEVEAFHELKRSFGFGLKQKFVSFKVNFKVGEIV